MDLANATNPPTSMNEEIEDIKRLSATLQQRAEEEVEHLRVVFLEEERKMDEAWSAFAMACDNHKKIRQIVVACDYEERHQQKGGENILSTTAAATASTSSTSSSSKKKKKNATLSIRKRNIRNNTPLRTRRDWSEEDIERLRRAGNRVDSSLKGRAFWIALHKSYGAKRRRINSVQSKARRLGIKPLDG